jgi:aspartate/methionine/tyrosine aminotransferase
MLLPLSLWRRAVFDRVHARCEGERAGGGIAIENLFDDRLAHRVYARACASDRRDDEAAKPFDFESGIDRAESGRRDFVVSRLRAIPGVRCNEPKGAFYVYPNIGVALGCGISSPLQFCEQLLDKAAVAVVPGEAFGTGRHVRISYATSMHELERGLERLHRFIVEQ